MPPDDRSTASATAALLADIAGELLLRRDPTRFLDVIFQRVTAAAGVDVYFHYRKAPDGRLRLSAYHGVDEHTAGEIAELSLGQAVCGTVAQRGERIVLRHVIERTDDMTALLRRLGVASYVCHPLLGDGRTIGTLSFGSRSQPVVGEDVVELLRAVSQLVAAAIQRFETESALEASEDLLRQTTDALPVLVAHLDADLRCRLVNRAYETLFDGSRRDVLGKRLDELLEPDDVATLQPWLRRAMAGETVQFRRDVRLPNDRTLIAETTLVPQLAAGDRVVGLFVLVHDISGVERTARALRRSESEYRSAFEHAGVGKAECDTHGVLRRINAKLAQMLGRREEDLLGQPFSDFVHPEDRGRDREAVRALLAGERREHQAETRYLCGDGNMLHALVTTTVLRDDSETPDRILTTVQDVTDRRRVADALRVSERIARKQARRLAESDRRKDEFLAVLGHELRNPLAALASGIQVLQRGAGTADDRAWALEMMGHQTSRLGRLLDDLLDVARISRGEIRLETASIDMAKVVAAAMETVRPLYHDQRHELHGEVAPALPVRGDALRLEQVVVNLLTNAARYTPPGGTIELRAERRGDVIEIRVRDNGIGLSPAATERIFEPFAQVREPGSPGGGLGIGLTLVRRLVTMHDGTVTVHSDGLGRGSTFTVRLPASNEDAPNVVTQAEPPPSMDQALTVLVVDDNEDAARALAMLLELHGCRTEVACCGQDCLTAASRNHPHVVLLDLGLPDVPGYEVARRLRATYGEATPLLVAVTGYGHEEARRQTADAGFDHHLLKPVGDRALVELLASVRT